MWRSAEVFTLKLAVALPDGTAIFAGRVPDLRAIKALTITADNSAAEKAHAAVMDTFTPCKLHLYQVKFLWADDGRVALFYIILPLKQLPTISYGVLSAK